MRRNPPIRCGDCSHARFKFEQVAQTGETRHGKKRGRPLYSYRVMDERGYVLGYVEQHEVMRSRMAGRLRVRDFWPLRWSYRLLAELQTSPLIYYSRAEAARRLAEEFRNAVNGAKRGQS